METEKALGTLLGLLSCRGSVGAVAAAGPLIPSLRRAVDEECAQAVAAAGRPAQIPLDFQVVKER